MVLRPLGTANDFATAAGIPDDALEALELVRTARPRVIDLLRLDAGGHTHWAANLASGGFGTQVTVETHDGLKKILGGLAYMVTGMRSEEHTSELQSLMRISYAVFCLKKKKKKHKKHKKK